MNQIKVQSKAVLIEFPGVGLMVRTDDGRSIVISPELARDLAQKILETVFAAPVPVGMPIAPQKDMLQ